MTDKTIFALGFFDGVHLGHQALLKACRELAQQHHCKAGVVTFLGHPDQVVSGQKTALINTYRDRRCLLKRYGMDTVVELPFDEDEYDAFLERKQQTGNSLKDGQNSTKKQDYSERWQIKW